MEELFLRLGVPDAWVEVLNLGMFGRLLLASLLGGLIGLEREMSGKPAGLRTNLLICVGAALLMDLSIEVAERANVQNAATGTQFRADPSRIAAQIVSGIGFLGAGTILQARGSIIGLTTAATIWVVAAIGMAVGARAYVEAAGSTLLVFLALVLLGRLENLVIRRRRTRRYVFTLDQDPDLLAAVEKTFRDDGLQVETSAVEKKEEQFEASFDVAGPGPRHDRVVRDLMSRPGIRKITRAF